MASTNSYKAKAEKLALVLAERTKVAEGWKKLAEHRLTSLSALSGSMTRAEASILTMPVWDITGIASVSPIATLITTAFTIGEGLDTASEAAANLERMARLLSEEVQGAYNHIEGAWKVASRPDLDLPEGAIQELEGEVGGLSLEEMGAYRSSGSTFALGLSTDDQEDLLEAETVSLPFSPSVEKVAKGSSHGHREKEKKKTSRK